MKGRSLMQDLTAFFQQFSFCSIALRLVLAMAVGGVLGLGRTRRGRSAGFRTYMLISVGAAMCAMISLYLYQMLKGPWAETAARVGEKFDASRMAAQAMTGIGFLGAGIIVKEAHQQVNGVTTATGLFAAVCMGVAAGVGFYEVVLLAVLVVGLVLNLLSPLEGAFKRHLRNITLYVEFDSTENISVITELLNEQHVHIYDIDIEQTEQKASKSPSAIFVLQMSRENHSHSGILSSLAELSCVRSVQELIS